MRRSNASRWSSPGPGNAIPIFWPWLRNAGCMQGAMCRTEVVHIHALAQTAATSRNCVDNTRDSIDRTPLQGSPAALPSLALPQEHAMPPLPASSTSVQPDWPGLPYGEWKETYATLHLWTQIVGKIRLVQSPWLNHSWHVPLYVSARGLTTSPIPYGT